MGTNAIRAVLLLAHLAAAAVWLGGMAGAEDSGAAWAIVAAAFALGAVAGDPLMRRSHEAARTGVWSP